MVYILIMAAALAVRSANGVSEGLPTFQIPAFDYTTIVNGNTPSRLLEALQSDGIIALQNIPNYAHLRERYLRKAAECVALTGSDSFISRKLFSDGTQRRTISTNAGRELKGSAVETDTACPGYRKLYEEFSRSLEHAVNTFGSALDKTSFIVSDGERVTSSRRLVSDSVRLDHFHLYEANPMQTNPTNEEHRNLELSLPLHEDHGLFIAMSAPKFYDLALNSRHLVERHLEPGMTGLVIQTSSGRRVLPVIKEDELVIMMGTGASRWLQTSHSLPAVMHGMKMPESSEATEDGTRRLRAWFGKMTLLPAYQRMLSNQDIIFEDHVNATRRVLLRNEESDIQTVGCATGRDLQASDQCTFLVCNQFVGATPPEPCNVICNREGHGPQDAENCAKNCNCMQSTGKLCWMLCVSNLPVSECPLDQQKCTDDQKMVCTGSTSPSSTTTSPSNPSSSSPTSAPTGSVSNAPNTESGSMTNDNTNSDGSGKKDKPGEKDDMNSDGSASEMGSSSGSSTHGHHHAQQDDVEISPTSTPPSSTAATITSTLVIITLAVTWTL